MIEKKSKICIKILTQFCHALKTKKSPKHNRSFFYLIIKQKLKNNVARNYSSSFFVQIGKKIPEIKKK